MSVAKSRQGKSAEVQEALAMLSSDVGVLERTWDLSVTRPGDLPQFHAIGTNAKQLSAAQGAPKMASNNTVPAFEKIPSPYPGYASIMCHSRDNAAALPLQMIFGAGIISKNYSR